MPTGGLSLPDWTQLVDAKLLRAFRSIRLLGTATPINAAEERANLIAAWSEGRCRAPTWRYVERDMGETGELLLVIASMISDQKAEPLRDAYLARIEELVLETTLAATVGTAAFSSHARLRFSPLHATDADPLAGAWIESPLDGSPVETVQSDSNDPRSLLSQMRAACGTRKLPFRVSAAPSLAALAATGEETILVASGRELSLGEISRTVVHEIQGHAEPRARARTSGMSLLILGTSRGADEQEGLALAFEKRARLLDNARKRQLAARHLSVKWMDDGATFVDVAQRLIRNHGFRPNVAIPLAERAFRGGDGTQRGLGRDVVYLDSLLAVEQAIEHGAIDVLTAGQVGTEWIDTVRPYLVAQGPASPVGTGNSAAAPA